MTRPAASAGWPAPWASRARGTGPPAPAAGLLVTFPGRGEVFAGTPAAADRSRRPPVLLLHGWTVSADLNFFAVYDELATRHRVIALDHRGHGRGLRPQTPFSLEDCADDAAALLAELGLGPVIVVGFSMGGAIAMLLHHRHPDWWPAWCSAAPPWSGRRAAGSGCSGGG